MCLTDLLVSQESFPDSFSHLNALKELDASWNNITVVGSQFERLLNLETLQLTHNDNLNTHNMPLRTKRLHEKVLTSFLLTN